MVYDLVKECDTVSQYTIDVLRGYGLNPVCVWENKSLSASKRKGKVFKNGNLYGFVFHEKTKYPF